MRKVAAQMIVSKLPQPQQGGLAPVDPVDDHDDDAQGDGDGNGAADAEHGEHDIEPNGANQEAEPAGALRPLRRTDEAPVSALPKPGTSSEGASSPSDAVGAGLEMSPAVGAAIDEED